MLVFDNVSFSYTAESKIVDGLSFSARPGEFISVVGVSGSGKSTIFRLITGLDQPSSGTISLTGHDEVERLGKVGYMPQQDLLLPWRTILENARLPLEIAGVDKKMATDQVMPLLQEFGLTGTEHQYPSQLSGGMKQRVAFLRALLSGSPLLLLDEPFSALDAITKLSMQEWLIQQWTKRQSTILFITHDVEEALFLSDRIFLLTDKPITSFQEVVVPLTRPRTRKDLHQPEILVLKEQMLQKLQSEVTL